MLPLESGPSSKLPSTDIPEGKQAVSAGKYTLFDVKHGLIPEGALSEKKRLLIEHLFANHHCDKIHDDAARAFSLKQFRNCNAGYFLESIYAQTSDTDFVNSDAAAMRESFRYFSNFEAFGANCRLKKKTDLDISGHYKGGIQHRADEKKEYNERRLKLLTKECYLAIRNNLDSDITAIGDKIFEISEPS